MNNENNGIVDSLMNYEIKEEIIDLPFDHIYAIATQNIDSPPTNFLQTSTGYGFSEHSEHQSRIKEANFQNEMDRLSICLNANQKEIQKLKNLSLVHLDLIQKQNDLIIKRDKLLSDYKLEIEMLKMRLDRMEQRSDTQNQGPPPLLDMRPAGGNRRAKSQNPPPLTDMRQGRGNRRSETQTRRQRTTETSSSSSDISVGQPCTVVTKPWTFRTDDAIDPSETGSWWSENQGGSMFGAKRSPSIPPVPSPFSTRWIGKECHSQATVEASRANNSPTKMLYSYNKKKKDGKSESFKKNQPAKNNPTISVTKPKGQTSATTSPLKIWDNAIRDAGASKSYCKSRIRKKAESKLPTPSSLLSANTTTDEGSRLTASDKNPSADDFSSSPGVYKYDAQAEIDCTKDRSTGVRKLGDTSKPKVYDTDFIKPHDSAKSYNAERSLKEKSYDIYLNSFRDDCESSPTKVPTPPPPPPPPAGPAQVKIYDYLQQDQVPKERCVDLSNLCIPVPKSEELRKTSYVSKKYTNKYFGLASPAKRKRTDSKIFDFLSKDDIQKKNVTFEKPAITEADFEWGSSETGNDDFVELCKPTTQPDAEGISMEYQYEDEDDDEEHDDPYRKYARPYNLKRPHTSTENNTSKYPALSAQPDSPARKAKDALENLDHPLADFDSFKSKSTGPRNIETSCRDFSYGESSLIGSRFQPESVKPFDMDSSSISPTYPLYVPDHHDSPEKNRTPDIPIPDTAVNQDFMTDAPVKSPDANLKNLKRSANQEKCAPRKRAKSTNTTIVTRSRTDPAAKFSWANDQKKPTTAAAITKPLPLIMPGSSYPHEGGENAPSTSAAWNNNLDFSLNAEKPNLEVPKWRIVEITDGSYCSEPEENVEDSTYAKRHLKMELEERRIKRWDIKRLKEQNLLKKLKDRQEKINSGGNKVTWSYKTEKKNPRQKTWPSYDDVMYIEVTDTLPSEEFPEVVPELETPKREPALPRLRSGAKKRKRRTVSKRKGKATAPKVAKIEVVQKAATATATEKNEESNKKD